MNLPDAAAQLEEHERTQVADAVAGRSIALAGAGALGSEVARQLMAAGAPRVLVIDPDVLAGHNLALSTLYTAAGSSQLGRPKADIVREQAAACTPPLTWQSAHTEIADVGLARLREVDLLLTAPDTTLARLESAYTARLLRLPMIDGGIHADGTAAGRVAFYPAAPSAACYSCGLTEARRAELLTFANSPAAGCRVPADHAPMAGSTALVQAVASAMLRALVSPTAEAWSQIITSTSATAPVPLPLNAACPWHTLPAPGSLREIPSTTTLQALWQDPADCNLIFDLPWPICLRARCRTCGQTCEPRTRLARTRRSLACPACGNAGTLEPVETLTSLAREDSQVNLTAQQLGLPTGHLLSARVRIRWSAA